MCPKLRLILANCSHSVSCRRVLSHIQSSEWEQTRGRNIADTKWRALVPVSLTLTRLSLCSPETRSASWHIMKTGLNAALDPTRRSDDAREFETALRRKIVGKDQAVE